jgi:HK97 gp10 family phage protein
MSLHLDGMSDLLSKLARLGAEADQLKSEALLAGAKVVQQAAINKVPKDTGKLAENIVVSDIAGETVQIGPNSDGFYGMFLEFGREAHGKRGKRKGNPSMTPRPFLQPAFEEKVDEVQDEMASVIKGRLGL